MSYLIIGDTWFARSIIYVSVQIESSYVHSLLYELYKL